MAVAGESLSSALNNDDFCPPLKKKKLQIARNVDARFSSPPKAKFEQYQKPLCPENTTVNTRWAVKNFHDW